VLGVGVGEDGTTTGAMVMLYVPVAVWAGVAVSVTVTVTVKEPAAVGVPLIAPAELMLSPAGSPVAAYVLVPAPPAAVTVAE